MAAKKRKKATKRKCKNGMTVAGKCRKRPCPRGKTKKGTCKKTGKKRR